MACDLYNRSMGNQLNLLKRDATFTDKVLSLPVGRIHVTFKTVKIPWNIDELATILPADTFEVHGLSVRNRTSGLGAPILAVRKKRPGMPVSSAVAATLFAEIKGGIRDISDGNCISEVSIFTPGSMGENEITVEGKKVPLEIDMTAALAYSLNDPLMWSLGRNLFRLGRSLFEPGIYATQPYEPGRIPVVFVHGTMSSPVWWAEMFNTLLSDPQIRQRFQIWLYLYDSGKPVVFSSNHLRESLENKIKECDPEGKDPALRNAVVVGHSQGGLLTRWTVTESGETLIRAFTGKSLDELDLTPEQRETATRLAIVHPMPEVKRVIFISTPHRGSILANNIARRIAAKFISLPREVIQTGTQLFSIYERFTLAGKLKWGMPRTSIDSMSPDNPGLLALAELPFPTDVKAHSIIAIKGKEKPPEGDDGVVAYKSAHLDDVESELVVPYSHSCQVKPLVIEEVRRILIEHLQENISSAAPAM
jgi:pimeloyl-ACP methyl ester carboxylesterase